MFKLLLNSQNCRFFLWLSFLKPIKSCLLIIWIPKRNDPVCFWRRIETVLYYLQVLLRGWQGWTWMHGNWMNWVKWGQALERFSFECRKVIGFALSTRCDWLKRFAPPFHPIRSKTKANCDALACIFPRFASATCNYFEFWLVQCIVCVLCDWPE